MPEHQDGQIAEDMKRSAEQVQRQAVATALNLLAADQAVLRLTLQYLILNAFGAQSEVARKLLANMKVQVVESIGRMALNEKAPEGAERAKKLHLNRAEQLFQELERAVDTVEAARSASEAAKPQGGSASKD